MRLVIEAREFATLSRDTQEELLGRFAGKDWLRRADLKKPSAKRNELVNLTPVHAARLVETLSEKDRRLLQLFAQRGGRVTLNELVASRGESDPETVSRFLSEVTQKVHAMLGDDFRDEGVFAGEQGSGEKTTIYHVSESTAQALRCFFPNL